MKIIATACRGRDLKPGDLFSTMGPEYWDHIHVTRAVGERVYIRINSSAIDDVRNKVFYRIEVIKSEQTNK